MSSCTHACLDVYKDAVDNTCDAVDSGIKVCTSFFFRALPLAGFMLRHAVA